MAANGVEIDMLSLGDADSLLVTLWENGRPTYTLIDCGYAKDAPAVTRFLQRRGVKTIHHLVCSHRVQSHPCQGLCGFSGLLLPRTSLTP
jgi:beta-lactamase superfamily II metal-dependent hydrolase